MMDIDKLTKAHRIHERMLVIQELMVMHKEANGRHNYYAFAANKLLDNVPLKIILDLQAIEAAHGIKESDNG